MIFDHYGMIRMHAILNYISMKMTRKAMKLAIQRIIIASETALMAPFCVSSSSIIDGMVPDCGLAARFDGGGDAVRGDGRGAFPVPLGGKGGTGGEGGGEGGEGT